MKLCNCSLPLLCSALLCSVCLSVCLSTTTTTTTTTTARERLQPKIHGLGRSLQKRTLHSCDGNNTLPGSGYVVVAPVQIFFWAPRGSEHPLLWVGGASCCLLPGTFKSCFGYFYFTVLIEAECKCKCKCECKRMCACRLKAPLWGEDNSSMLPCSLLRILFCGDGVGGAQCSSLPWGGLASPPLFLTGAGSGSSKQITGFIFPFFKKKPFHFFF